MSQRAVLWSTLYAHFLGDTPRRDGAYQAAKRATDAIEYLKHALVEAQRNVGAQRESGFRADTTLRDDIAAALGVPDPAGSPYREEGLPCTPTRRAPRAKRTTEMREELPSHVRTLSSQQAAEVLQAAAIRTFEVVEIRLQRGEKACSVVAGRHHPIRVQGDGVGEGDSFDAAFYNRH